MRSLVWMKGRLTKIFKTTSDFGSFVFCMTKMRRHMKVLIFQRSLLKASVSKSCDLKPLLLFWSLMVKWRCAGLLVLWCAGLLVLLSSAVSSDYSALISSIAGKLDCILQCPGIPTQALRCLAGLLLCGSPALLREPFCQKGPCCFHQVFLGKMPVAKWSPPNKYNEGLEIQIKASMHTQYKESFANVREELQSLDAPLEP